ncbi:MAG: ATP-binding cassette domain-containing protein [Bacteroidetes bacterium]|nr:ATP-binding cassette domain-containing protein [Bacteroidota bacterium]
MKITFQDCGKNYHRTWLFRHLNLELDLGLDTQPLKLALLGGNGSGKSTLTLMISGQTNPTEGSIDWLDIHGKQITSDSWYQHIALASPALELPEEFTLQEWFNFHQSVKGFASGVTLDRLISICGFSNNTKSKALLTFSSGMKQRVKLCMALMGTESLVILDEPLTNLDLNGSQLYDELLKTFLGNRALIIASNREDEWKPYCNQVLDVTKINAEQAV